MVFFGDYNLSLLRKLMNMPEVFIGNFPLYAFFLGNFDLIYHSDSAIFVIITWSVGIEEQFYIFWAILFLILPKYYISIISSYHC